MGGHTAFRGGIAATAMAALWALSVPVAAAGDMSILLNMSDEELMRGTDKQGSYYASLYRCPSACAEAPTQPGNWTTYTSLDQISGCNETVLFDLAIANPIADTTTPTKLRVCSLGTASESSTVAQKRSQAASDACVASAVATTATLQLTTGGQASGKEDNTAKALEALAQYFSANCDSRLMLSHVDGIFAGVYMGPGFGRGTAASAIQAILDDVKSGSGSPGTIISQLCGVGKSRAHTFGVAVGNITTVQRALQTWNNASCVAELENTRQLAETSIWETPVTLNNASSLPTNGTLATNGTIANGTLAARHDGRIGRRGLCTLTTVQGGDTCTTLAARCGISLADFEKYNPDPTLCAATSSSLMPDQYVCCSDGGMDDLIPKVGADGICFTYHIVEGDTCGSIAGQRGLKVQDIDDFNKGKTFAWYGCDKLLVDTNICLSEGKRPMPYPNKDAVCGPTVVGSDSTYVESNDDLINLNPCPLNACCNVWGNCGISGDFCNEAAGPEGNPGTSALTNGCVSSCGTDIVNTGTAPASYQRVGYYETWNFNRPCLWMSAASTTKAGSSGGGDAYTHVHWAFAAVNTADWTVQINDPFNQWADFKKLNVKRIVSFGGWGYSTDEATYDILREAMSPANRATFAANVAKFLSKEGIDGADFDWEYPGATDIPGTPPGQPDDGVNYIKFLTTLRGVLPAGKSMSIAAPASFWYLKAFPIDKMALTLDYIVFMTYDLHGQWDAGNQYSIEGCPAGNCLRSHVNITETKTALSMITKAGVNTNLIFVGESSYGRSFKMAAAGCEGPDCTFTGDRLNSNAAKGKCTDTAGYISNAEIIQIIQDADVSIHSYYDAGSDSDILVYDETEWVAYMTDTTKNRRRASWKGYNFAGTIDWALDLQRYTDDTPYEVVYVATEIYGGTPAECTGPCILVLPPSSLASATTISFPPYTTSLEFAPGLTSTIVINVPPYTTDAMPFYNVNVTQGLTAGQFIPTGSIDLPPIVTTITGPSGLTQTRTLTLPPWPAMTNGVPASWSTSIPGPWQTTSSPVSTPVVVTGSPLPWVTGDEWPSSFPEEWGTDVEVPSSTTSSTTVAAVIWPPSWTVTPVPETITGEGEDPDDIGPLYKTPCTLWFFFICVNWEGIEIGGWQWFLPTGVWGPGPPPLDKIKLPPGVTIRGTLPPWPKITVDPKGKPTYDDKPEDCEPAEAELCITVSSFGTTVTNQVTVTTATEVKSTCATVTGCDLKDVATTTTIENGCTPTNGPLSERADPPSPWEECQDGPDGIVLLKGGFVLNGVTPVRALLDQRAAYLQSVHPDWDRTRYSYEEIRSEIIGFTAYFYVYNMGPNAKDYLNQQTQYISSAYYFQEDISYRKTWKAAPWEGFSRSTMHIANASVSTPPNLEERASSKLDKRTPTFITTDQWHLSQLSVPPGEDFSAPDGVHNPQNNQWTAYFDDTLGQGQTIYIVDEGFYNLPEFSTFVEDIPMKSYGAPVYPVDEHGTIVAAMAGGKNMGVARKATLVHVQHPPSDNEVWPMERHLEALINVANHIQSSGAAKDTTVVNLSWGFDSVIAKREVWATMAKIMSRMEATLGTVFVAAAGNTGAQVVYGADGTPRPQGTVWTMPQLLSRPNVMPNMILVGASGVLGKMSSFSQNDPSVALYAPGETLNYPSGWLFDVDPLGASGTSYAAPMVAGLVAALRAETVMNVKTPAEVKAKIIQLSRPIHVSPDPGGVSVNVVWNGQNHLNVCTVQKRGLFRRLLGLFIRQDDNSCPTDPNGGGSSGGGGGAGGEAHGPPVTFTQGPPGPTCTAGCGHLCTGAYCNANPTGTPGDFFAPTVTSNPSDLCAPATTTAGTTLYTYCDCGTGYASTLPFLPSTTAPCAYTSLPPICRFGAQPQENKAYCNCEGYPHTLPTLTTKSNVCGYTSFPDPWPYTYTNGDGAVIACETSSVGGGKTDCAGDFYTATQAPPKPSTTPRPHCIVARTMMNNDPSMGDLINVQIFQNGIEVCYGGQTIWFASSSTEYDIDCGKDNGRGALGPGASVKITNNGGKIVYKAADGWEAEIPRTNVWHTTEDCGNYRCSMYESTFDNGCTNCPTFGYCNYWSYCALDGECS